MAKKLLGDETIPAHFVSLFFLGKLPLGSLGLFEKTNAVGYLLFKPQIPKIFRNYLTLFSIKMHSMKQIFVFRFYKF